MRFFYEYGSVFIYAGGFCNFGHENSPIFVFP